MGPVGAREGDARWVGLSPGLAMRPRGRGRAGASVALRPRSAPRLLDLAAEVLAVRFLAAAGVCTLVWFPLRAVTPWFVDFLATNPLGYGGDEGFTAFVASMLFLMTAQTLAGILSTTSVTVLVHAELVGRPSGALAALGRSLRRLPALVGVFLVNMLVIGLGGGFLGIASLLCPIFLPFAVGYYLLFTWKLSVAPSALVLEDLGIFGALGRSWELTRGSFPRWLGVQVLAFLAVAGLTLGTQVGDDPTLKARLIDGLGLPKALFETLFVAVSSVFSGLSTAVVAAAMTAYYLDTRIRREGFDLAMRLERLRVAEGP